MFRVCKTLDVGSIATAASNPDVLLRAALEEYILDWEDVRDAPDQREAARSFGLSAIRHASRVCGWDSAPAASGEGVPPPVS